MPIEVVTALIAVMGVFVAAVISYITSQRQVKTEILKFRTEAQNVYGDKLFEKRLEVYPELFSYISDFIKLMRYGEISKEAINNLFTRWQDWDSKNSILFNAYTHGVSSPLRHELGLLSQKTDDEIKIEFETKEQKEAFKKKLQKVELALRHELGVFAFELPMDLEKFERQLSYEEAHIKAGLEK